MKFARIGTRGAEIPVVVTEDHYRDLRPALGPGRDLDPAMFASGAIEALVGQSQVEALPVVADRADHSIRLSSPLAAVGSIFCIGMNYAAHAAESGSEPPEVPILFLKAASTLAGPYDDVAVPRGSQRTDWEVELGVVIGRRALYLDSPREALSHIAGYVAANDLSERDFQLEQSGGQWSKGKCSPGFSPLGPWLVTPDEIDPADLRLRSWVNGEPRQDSSTRDLVFDVGVVVHHLSQYVALEPGDVILTGTPEGVALSGRFPYLRPGDIVEVEIEGLGRQRQQMVAWNGVAR